MVALVRLRLDAHLCVQCKCSDSCTSSGNRQECRKIECPESLLELDASVPQSKELALLLAVPCGLFFPPVVLLSPDRDSFLELVQHSVQR